MWNSWEIRNLIEFSVNIITIKSQKTEPQKKEASEYSLP